MRYSEIAVSILLSCGTASASFAEEHRQHGAHEHGGGQLNVAVEQKSLMIDLSLPAMNIVGFEHPANDDKERSLVAQAADQLRDGMRLFVPSPAAKCTQTRSDVKSALLGNADDDEEAGHADFDVDYEFSCAEPSQLSALTLSLFERFPATQHLRAQVITPAGQTGAELSAGNNRLELK